MKFGFLFLLPLAFLIADFVYDPVNPSYEAVNTTINNAYRQVFVQITVSTDQVVLQVQPPPRSAQIAALVAANSVSSVGVSSNTITQNFTELASTGGISVDFTLTALPNPLATTGYQFLLQVLPVRLNVNIVSALFFFLQAASVGQQPFISGTTTLLYHDLTYQGNSMKRWAGFPVGTFLSPTWNDVGILEALHPTAQSSSITFSFTVGTSVLKALDPGTYWTNFIVTMLPPSQAISTTTLIPQEISLLQTFHSNIAATLAQTGLPAATTLILSQNQTFLTQQLALLAQASPAN